MSRAQAPRNLIVVISGPSGVGKSSVISRLFSLRLKDSAEFSISTTTRLPRPGEKDGESYRFVSRDEFMKLKGEGCFAEWAEVHGELYGTPRSEIERILNKGKDLILELDVQGGSSMKKLYPDAVAVFLAVSGDELRSRLRNRPTSLSPEEFEAENQRRMEVAKKELQAVRDYSYLIINEDLEKTVKMIHSIMEAERCRIIGGKLPPHSEEALNGN